jgi:hypothetical protein
VLFQKDIAARRIVPTQKWYATHGLLAAALGIDAIEIESGHSSPSKIIAITGMDDEAIRKVFE